MPLELAKNQVYHSRTKHIDVWFHFIKDILDEGDIRLRKIGIADNLANNLVKVVFEVKFQYYRNLANIL